MSKYLINNTNETVNMSKQDAVDVFTGICNLLEGYETNELFVQLLSTLTKQNTEQLLNFCCERFPRQTEISLLENSIIEES